MCFLCASTIYNHNYMFIFVLCELNGGFVCHVQHNVFRPLLSLALLLTIVLLLGSNRSYIDWCIQSKINPSGFQSEFVNVCILVPMASIFLIWLNQNVITTVVQFCVLINWYFTFLQSWRDEILTWDPSDFGGIEDVTIPQGMVWVPSISLVNT